MLLQKHNRRILVKEENLGCGRGEGIFIKTQKQGSYMNIIGNNVEIMNLTSMTFDNNWLYDNYWSDEKANFTPRETHP